MPFNCQMRKVNDLFFFSWDSLTIYDGNSSTSPMMGMYCDDSIPPSHVSSTNEIFIHFQSDIWGASFQMAYNTTGKQNTSIQISKAKKALSSIGCTTNDKSYRPVLKKIFNFSQLS